MWLLASAALIIFLPLTPSTQTCSGTLPPNNNNNNKNKGIPRKHEILTNTRNGLTTHTHTQAHKHTEFVDMEVTNMQCFSFTHLIIISCSSDLLQSSIGGAPSKVPHTSTPHVRAISALKDCVDTSGAFILSPAISSARNAI